MSQSTRCTKSFDIQAVRCGCLRAQMLKARGRQRANINPLSSASHYRLSFSEIIDSAPSTAQEYRVNMNVTNFRNKTNILKLKRFLKAKVGLSEDLPFPR